MNEREFEQLLDNMPGSGSANDWEEKVKRIVRENPKLFRLLARARIEAECKGFPRKFGGVLHELLSENIWHGNQSFVQMLFEEGLPYISRAKSPKEFEYLHHVIVTNPIFGA